LIKVKFEGLLYPSPANYFLRGGRETDGVISTGPHKLDTFDFDVGNTSAGYRATPKNTVFSVTKDNIILNDVTD